MVTKNSSLAVMSNLPSPINVYFFIIALLHLTIVVLDLSKKKKKKAIVVLNASLQLFLSFYGECSLMDW